MAKTKKSLVSKKTKKKSTRSVSAKKEIIVLRQKTGGLWFMSTFAFIVSFVIVLSSIGFGLYSWSGAKSVEKKYDELSEKVEYINQTSDDIKSGKYDFDYSFEKFEDQKEAAMQLEIDKLDKKKQEFDNRYSSIYTDLQEQQEQLQEYINNIQQALDNIGGLTEDDQESEEVIAPPLFDFDDESSGYGEGDFEQSTSSNDVIED